MYFFIYLPLYAPKAVILSIIHILHPKKTPPYLRLISTNGVKYAWCWNDAFGLKEKEYVGVGDVGARWR